MCVSAKLGWIKEVVVVVVDVSYHLQGHQESSEMYAHTTHTALPAGVNRRHGHLTKNKGAYEHEDRMECLHISMKMMWSAAEMCGV